ncbi:MAG: UDP-N-acetylmuramoyl-L-alanine--D-glutamate ligase [Candidatus Dormibacteria bacterium]
MSGQVADLPAACAVVGFGRSGRAVAEFLLSQGVRVRVLDQRPPGQLAAVPPSVDLRAGGYGPDDLEGMGALFVSPGVPWHDPVVEAARARGMRVASELELFLERNQTPVLAVTGTNGKTTTATWTHHLLETAGRTSVLAGNVGVAALGQLDAAALADHVVLEVSSYQLEALPRTAFAAAAVLNLAPDHLARHGTFAQYSAIKARAVLELPAEGLAVLNRDDPVTWALSDRVASRIAAFTLGSGETGGARRASLDHDQIRLHEGPDQWTLLASSEMPLPGRHNLQNAMAAALLAREAGVAPDQLSSGLRTFSGVEHRLERLPDVGEVAWFNDSKATNPESTISALAALRGRSLVLIAGGQSKGTGFAELASAIAATCSAVVLMGESAGEMRSALDPLGVRVETARDMTEAVALAARLSRPGGTVVLSPACASFDMFDDYEHRGREFRLAVAAAGGRP